MENSQGILNFNENYKKKLNIYIYIYTFCLYPLETTRKRLSVSGTLYSLRSIMI
jgi:hypothetical protein